MNQIFISLLFILAASLRLTGQITVTNTSFPAVGDTLRIATDNSPTGIAITPPGGAQTWDFTSLESGFLRTLAVRAAAEGQNPTAFPTATLVVPANQNGENYYRVTPTAYELVGFAGADPLNFGINVVTPFNPVLVERRAPMNFFDINQTGSNLLAAFDADDLPPALLALFPIQPDSVRLRVAINRSDVVDGWGTLAIPGGTYQVLRERRLQYSDTRIDVKISVLPWTDVTALIPLPGAGLGRDTTLTYNFFSNVAKEPIAVITADHETGEVLFAQFKYNGPVSNTGDLAAQQASVRFYPNPASGLLQVEWADMPRDRYQITLFNALGQRVLHRSFDAEGNTVLPLDISALHSGIYAFRVTGSAGNIVSAGPLIVANPR